MKSKWLIFLLGVLLVIGMMAGCSAADQPEEKQTIKIGFLTPLSGPGAAEGAAARNAFSLAMDKLNNSGILKYQVEVVTLDDAEDENSSAKAAKKLIKDDDVVAICGHWNTTAAEKSIPLCVKAQTPLIIWGAKGEDLLNEETAPYVTRVIATDSQENIPIAKNLIDALGYKKILIVSDNSTSGQANAAKFSTEAAKYQGATIAGTIEIKSGQTDFSEVVAQVKKLAPQAIYFGGTATEGSLLYNQLAQAKLNNLMFFGTSGIITNEFLQNTGSVAAGIIANHPGVLLSKTDAGKQFLLDYVEAKYEEPLGEYSAYAYDAGRVIIQALKTIKGMPTRENMTTAIAGITSTGLLGDTSFAKTGQTVNAASYMVVLQNGSWVPYTSSEYAAGSRALPGKAAKPANK